MTTQRHDLFKSLCQRVETSKREMFSQKSLGDSFSNSSVFRHGRHVVSHRYFPPVISDPVSIFSGGGGVTSSV